jgi:hypothetical protein
LSGSFNSRIDRPKRQGWRKHHTNNYEEDKIMAILNLTQHTATADQLAAGVVDPSDEMRAQICALLTFDECPELCVIEDVAASLAGIAWWGINAPHTNDPIDGVMIGGAPWLMSALERALKQAGIQPLYAFSRRESVEQTQADGSVKKINVFRHAGWVAV